MPDHVAVVVFDAQWQASGARVEVVGLGAFGGGVFGGGVAPKELAARRGRPCSPAAARGRAPAKAVLARGAARGRGAEKRGASSGKEVFGGGGGVTTAAQGLVSEWAWARQSRCSSLT
ncbi:hypothetical protein ACFL5O_12045, partial [Myxococcota bacterium]